MIKLLFRNISCISLISILFFLLVNIGDGDAFGESISCPAAAVDANVALSDPNRLHVAKMLVEYFEQMCVPKPFVVREGQDFKAHQSKLRQEILECMSIFPLPSRCPLDVHYSEPLDHPWCTVRRVYYQIWPGVYANGLLYMPKQFLEKPAPAMLCPHGHWADGSADTQEQNRCLVFAKNGYAVFAPTQNHYEDLMMGVSHQTLMVWSNMRALDFLESLPEVDKNRIGCAGCSGGGLQTEYLLAFDSRIKVATIVGYTSDFREFVFPFAPHCSCNHYPNVMRFTDLPEISSISLPVPVQYLTMNDWTLYFKDKNLPIIQRLYSVNGVPDCVNFGYWPTNHCYDRPKRDRAYWWADKWLCGSQLSEPENEPNVEVFAVKTVKGLVVNLPEDKGFGEISRIFEKEKKYKAPRLSTKADWLEYRNAMIKTLKDLLGEQTKLKKTAVIEKTLTMTDKELIIEHVSYPSEGGVSIPAIVIKSAKSQGGLPVVVILDELGKDTVLAQNGPDSAIQLAVEGAMVVIPDIRFYGGLSLSHLYGYFSNGSSSSILQYHPPATELSETVGKPNHILAWNRAAILWGRPLPGMAVTDIQSVIDGILLRPDVDKTNVRLIGCSSTTATSALLAAAIDSRVTECDCDFQNRCFAKRNLPTIPFMLQHGDILQCAALLADRKLTIRNVPKEAGDASWLSNSFEINGNIKGLTIR